MLYRYPRYEDDDESHILGFGKPGFVPSKLQNITYLRMKGAMPCFAFALKCMFGDPTDVAAAKNEVNAEELLKQIAAFDKQYGPVR
jgi:hypothetical protein